MSKPTKYTKYLGTKIYYTWLNLRQRCNNPNAESYKNYGGRGIKVCERWSRFTNFFEDMSKSFFRHLKKYGIKNTTIDRIDLEGNYEPDNCRWATWLEQNHCRRNVARKVN